MRRLLTTYLGIILLGPVALPLLLAGGSFAQREEVAAAMQRYKALEESSGYYEEYEIRPRRQRPLVGIPGVNRGLFPYSPSGAEVRIRTRLPDAHAGIRFYVGRRCQECHAPQVTNIHTVRTNITCRQCHGEEPIAGIHHYYSPLNPIRRHSYVCAKCHEGANVSFASYIIHVPNPTQPGAREAFPLLFYGFWLMIAVAVGTFAVFLPHTLLWGIREVVARLKPPGPPEALEEAEPEEGEAELPREGDESAAEEPPGEEDLDDEPHKDENPTV